jgi:hypothetical protein
MSAKHTPGPVEMRRRGRTREGRAIWDAFDTVINDWVGVVPPFPTTNRERVEVCVEHMNAHYASAAIAKARGEA